MNKYFIFIMLLGLFSCNGGCGKTEDSSSAFVEVDHDSFVPEAPKEVIGRSVDVRTIVDEKKKVQFRRMACSLVSAQIVAEALGRTKEEVQQRNATPRDADPGQTACFYKWSDYTVPNAGIFIQLMRNPLGEEYPDYVSKMIEGKKEMGERGIEEEAILFKTFQGFGDDGAYSTEAGKYFWRIGEEVVFQIAFNTAHTPQEQYNIATKLAKEATENFLASTTQFKN